MAHDVEPAHPVHTILEADASKDAFEQATWEATSYNSLFIKSDHLTFRTSSTQHDLAMSSFLV
jgi:hypothetical protein